MNNPWKRKEVIGDQTLYLGDCMDVMPTLGKVDAVVTDPPYGIGIDGKKQRIKNNRSDGKGYGFKGWDKETPSAKIFDQITKMSDNQIIWGGNYFQEKIDISGRGWLVWDKQQHGQSRSDGELAYSNLNKPLRIIPLNSGVLLRDGAQHPTQKPVAVMIFCIEHLPADTDIILDPFMGSGTTLVACAKLGRSGIGIELDEDYFNIACERVEKAYQQTDLFVAPPENKDIKRNQANMFDDEGAL